MSHLSRDERLLALDDALDPPTRAHLASCAACRAEVESLASVVARVKAVEVPEPSPLFWDHLAARVGDAIAREPAPERPRWWAPRPLWGVVAALVLAAVAAISWSARSADAPPQAVARTAPPSVAPSLPVAPDAADAGDPADASGDDGWRLIAAMADDADLDTLAPAAGGSELTIAGLTADERAALIRELEAALASGRGREG
jgi:hypothetical protein